MSIFARHLAIAAVFLAFVGSVSFVAADDDVVTKPSPKDLPRAVYRDFMRPPAAGKNYDTWKQATGPDVGETSADPARLPSRVDNSSRPQFPPVYRQVGGACGQYTAAASMFTYEMNVLRGTVAGSGATRFPAHFTWNMMNRAKDVGSEAYHAWEVAKHVGIPTIATYGGVHRDKIGEWPNGYEVWHDAMRHRVAGYRYTPAQTVAQLDEARGWMYDRNQPSASKPTIGGLMALDGRMGKVKRVTTTIPNGQYGAGEDVWIRWAPSGFGHGITCAGYDDHIGVDLNGDGKITNDRDINSDGKVTLADWERGAYIVVNSWGDSWSTDGKIYLLYSAMIDPTWQRGNFLGRVEVKQHTPRLTLKAKLSCDDRTDLRLTIGVAGDPSATTPEHEYKPEAFNGWPLFSDSNAGHVPMAGPDDNTPLEFGVDLTPLVDQLGPDTDGTGRLFMRVTRADGSTATGELHAAAVRAYDSQGKLLKEIPFAIDQPMKFGEEALLLDQAVGHLP